jgi:hypothetical protein
MKIFFTSVNANYLDKAVLLGESLKKVYTDCYFVIALLDRKLGDENNFDVVDEIIYPENLGIIDFKNWIFIHTVVEACTAQKARVFKLLIGKFPEKRITYLDPDCFVYSRLSEIEENGDHIFLTPHLLEFDQDLNFQNEKDSLKHGIYNLGFISIPGTKNGLQFADWWDQRLLSACFDDVPNGLFTDQKWINNAPIFFEKVTIIRDPGYNLATWNADTRELSIENGIPKVKGQVLKFAHFSGFDSGNSVAAISRLTNNREIFAELHKRYSTQLKEVGKKLKNIDKKWFYDSYVSGEKIDPVVRLKVRQVVSNIRLNLFESSNNELLKIIEKNTKNILTSNSQSNRNITILEKAKLDLFSRKYFENIQKYKNKHNDKTIIEILTNSNRSLPFVLFLTHNLGGGTEKYVKQIKNLYQNFANVLIVRPSKSMRNEKLLNFYEIECPMIEANQKYYLNGNLNQNLTKMIVEYFEIKKIHINHCFGLDSLIDEIIELPNAILDITLHDYAWINKNIDTIISNLGEKQSSQSFEELFESTIDQTTNNFQKHLTLFNKSSRIIAPSWDIKQRYEKVIGDSKIQVNWHPEFPYPELHKKKIVNSRNQKKKRNIALMNIHGPSKGLNLLRKVTANDKFMRSFNFINFGGAPIFNAINLGKYDPKDINKMLSESDIDLIWLPSIVPESYSYVLSEALQSDIPIMLSNFGAYKERVAHRSDCMLVQEFTDHTSWMDLTTNWLATQQDENMENFDIEKIANRDFYQKQYRS